ncbi:MAG: hypothetical protein AAGH90_09155 [Pseudomonadota bacterium]
MRVLALVTGLLVSALLASPFGHAEQGDWTPRDVEPLCEVPAAVLDKGTPAALKPFYTPEIVILKWHVYGADTPNQLLWEEKWRFEIECLSEKAKSRCGIPYNREIGRLVSAQTKKKTRRKAREPGGALYKVFENPPPVAAIDFAQRGLGKCFGSERTLQTRPEPDMTFIFAPLQTCNDYAYEQLKANADNWLRLHNLVDDDEQHLRAWVTSFVNRTRKFRDPRDDGFCTHVPTALADTILARARQERQILAAKRAAEQAEAQRLANRTIEERIAGLNGCQIAYSLVSNGLNAKPGGYQPVGQIPDDAISWALDYETANLNNKTCPVMPAALSEWVQNQPLNQFEAVPDPCAMFRRKTKPYAKTEVAWHSFVTIWMSRYNTQDVIVGNDISMCEKVRHYMQTRTSSAPFDSAERAFWQLFKIVGNDGIGASYACGVTPPEIIQPAKTKWAADLRAAQQAEALAKKRQRFLENLDRRLNPPPPANQSYLWPKQTSTRCYWAGDTKYGSKQACFTN